MCDKIRKQKLQELIEFSQELDLYNIQENEQFFGDKYMKLKRYGQTWELTPSFSKYYYNGRLVLALFEQDRSLFDVVTVNIEDKPITNENCSFIDTNNSGNEIITWLEENGFGKATGRFAVSGFCTYPEFEFKPDVIQKYKVEEIDIDL